MALTGSFNYYTYEVHPTETESVTMELPANLPENDPNYELRGTTATIEQPVMVENNTHYPSVHIFISAASVNTVASLSDRNLVNLHYIYKVYNSKEDRITENHIIEDGITTEWDYDTNSNPTEVAYNHLRTQKGFEELTNS